MLQTIASPSVVIMARTAERLALASLGSRRDDVGGRHRAIREPQVLVRGIVVGLALSALLWASVIPAVRLILLLLT